VSIALPNDQNGVVINWGSAEHWNIRSSTLRGGWRHSCSQRVFQRLRKVDPTFRMSTETARLLSLGGVKSSGASKLMTPLQIAKARRLNPLIEMFGCNDPAFFSGHTYVAHMISEDPIDRSRSNSRAYNLQVVRTPLSRGPFTADDLSDPERIDEFGEANRYRSQLDGLCKRALSVESRLARKPDAKLTKERGDIFAALKELTGQDFANAIEVKQYLEKELESMRQRGHSTVSEQTIPVGQEVIPIGVNFQHSVNIIGASRIGCGLLIDSISHKQFVNPIIGGRGAAGCGGWITSEYPVRRYEGDDLVDDCVIILKPEHHIEFHDAEHSVLRACYEEWRDCDIREFDFTYERLQQIANNGVAEEDS
jgi:hypothetical protein